VPYRAALNGFLGGGTPAPQPQRLDVGGLVDAVTGGAQGLIHQAYTRRMQEREQERLAQNDRFVRYREGFRDGQAPTEDGPVITMPNANGSPHSLFDGATIGGAYAAQDLGPSAGPAGTGPVNASPAGASGSALTQPPRIRVPGRLASDDIDAPAAPSSANRIRTPNSFRDALQAGLGGASGTMVQPADQNDGSPRRVRLRVTPTRYTQVDDGHYFDDTATPEARRAAAMTAELGVRSDKTEERQAAGRTAKDAQVEATIARRKAAYAAAGYEDADADVNPSIARTIMFPPTETHATNRAFDVTHPLPSRGNADQRGQKATQRFLTGRITSLVQRYMAPQKGKYGASVPGMTYDAALAQAKTVVGGALRAASESDDEPGGEAPGSGVAPASTGDVDLGAPTPVASTTSVPRVGPRGASPVGASSASALAKNPPPGARTPRPAAAIAQDAYDAIATGRSTIESAQQHLAAPVFQALQGLIKTRPISARR
jgi:hypothetical protein